MKWTIIKSSFSLRHKNRFFAALALRNERLAVEAGLFFITPLYLIFSVADAVSVPQISWFFWISLRLVTAGIGILLFFILRGRMVYATRNALFMFPYFYTIQGIMIFNDLGFTPYFAGLVVCLFTVSWLFPMRWKYTLPMYLALSGPALIFFSYHLFDKFSLSVVGLAMSVGSLGFCVINSHLIRDEVVQRLRASQALATELQSREEEVRQKVSELSRRKRFESQFSPQVINHILENESVLDVLAKKNICTAVFDIKDSTEKASLLPSENYSEVVEEIFDIISACCLKWNITIDKFTGDGAQAFAGAPNTHWDDLQRTISASADVIRMIKGREDYLSFRWKGEVQVKIGIVEGEALVGFLGKGSMRSFTAIGSAVSLAHRICAEAPPNSFLILTKQDLYSQISDIEYIKRHRQVKNLKGFNDRTFSVVELAPRIEQQELQALGRCKECATPLVLIEKPNGLPQLQCPSCILHEEKPSSNRNPLSKDNV